MPHYAPAQGDDWLLAVVDDFALICRSSQTTPQQLWDVLGGPDPIQSTLDLLTSGGVRATPDFAMARWSRQAGASALLLVRGPAVISVDAAAGRREFDGLGVATWLETRVDDVRSMGIVAGAVGAEPSVPIFAGVAWAASVAMTIDDLDVVAVPARRAQSQPTLPVIVDVATPEAGAQQQPKLRASRRHAHPESTTGPAAADGFYLELPGGTREPLNQPILVGRSPSVSKVSSGQIPRLLTIAGEQDISRNQAQFTLDGDAVIVTDLHSRNGTSVTVPGETRRLLPQGEPTPVPVGTVVDLGGGALLVIGKED
jgi:hypothetical protein